MKKKRQTKKKNKLKHIDDYSTLYILFVASLILIAHLIGNFLSTLVISFFSILIISAIYSFFKSTTFEKTLKETSFVLCFSILTALCASIILPYLLFHNHFFNLYAIQYLYLFPVIFVFFFSLHLFSSLIHKNHITVKKTLFSSFKLTLLISLILSLILCLTLNHYFNERAKEYYSGLDENINILTDLDSGPDLVIFNELNAYKSDFLNDIAQKRAIFKDRDSKNKFCILTNCETILADKAYHLVTIVLNTAILSGKLEQANNQLDYINSPGFNFTSLSEYTQYFENKLSYYSINPIVDLNWLDSDFSYLDLDIFINSLPDNDGLISSDAENFNILSGDSLFVKSQVRVLKHSILFKNVFKLVLKVAAYGEYQNNNGDILVNIYKHRNVSESLESKAIRYWLISSSMV